MGDVRPKSGSRFALLSGVRLRAILAQFNRLAQEENAQGTVEYILILSAVVVAASALGRKVIAVMDEGILRLGAELEKDLKTGRASLDVWKN